MGIQELCSIISDVYHGVDTENQDVSTAYQAVYALRAEIKPEEFSQASLFPILAVAKQIASTKKKSKQILEKELLSLIAYLPHKLWRNVQEEEQPTRVKKATVKMEQIAKYLIKFAQEMYAIKIDRDAFAGKRRGFAIQILGNLSYYYDVPEFMELCSTSVKSKSKNEFLDCMESLQAYYKQREEVPNDDLIAIIDKRIEKTKKRVEATSGLNFQVETGLISEWEALSRLDEWKEKNGRW